MTFNAQIRTMVIEVIDVETGDLLSLYRKQAGMTIDELAEKSGVPKGTLNKIIGGITKAPTLDTMKPIAKALGKTLADFDDPLTKKSPAPESEAEKDEGESALIDNYRKLNDKGRRRLLEMSADMVAGGRYEPFDPETQIKIGVAAVGRGPHRVIRDKETVLKAQEDFFEKKEDMDWHPPIK